MDRPENEMVVVRRRNGIAVVALKVITLKIKFDFCSAPFKSLKMETGNISNLVERWAKHEKRVPNLLHTLSGAKRRSFR